MHNFLKVLTIILLLATVVILIALQLTPPGWILLGTTGMLLVFCEKHFRRDMLLLVGLLGILALAPIDTRLTTDHMVLLTGILALTIFIPYIIIRFVYKEKTISFPFHRHALEKKDIFLIMLLFIITYLLLPFYLKNTGAYLNWTVEPTVDGIARLFIGTTALGAWDELFFRGIFFALLLKHFPFKVANAVQGVAFVSLLYNLGFTGWGMFSLFPLALLQGYLFRKKNSFFYVIIIHILLDIILSLVLISIYFPGWIKLFIT